MLERNTAFNTIDSGIWRCSSFVSASVIKQFGDAAVPKWVIFCVGINTIFQKDMYIKKWLKICLYFVCIQCFNIKLFRQFLTSVSFVFVV